MTDPIRKAAQALVDAFEGFRLPYKGEQWERLLDLRAALASPAPSPSTARDEEYVSVALCQQEIRWSEERGRCAALEEAAKVAEENDDSMMIGIGIAERIRSLKGQPPPAAPADQSKATP